MTYPETLAYVAHFSRSGAPVHDLSRIAGLLRKLGDPQDRLRFVHIAGTNGKGSVAEYLTNILIRSGYRTGTFTSPYVLCYEDRIRLNGENIPRAALCDCCAQVAAAVDGTEGYSQFEISFAIALLYYVQSGAEIVVLETGLGGLLDCTNVIAPPLCAVITSVSLDHMAILGNTVQEIAVQKAGIIKPGSQVVISPGNPPEVMQILRETAEQRGAGPVHIPDEEACFVQESGIAGNRFSYRSAAYTTRMGGRHQITNALTALAAAEVLRSLGFTLPPEAVQGALAMTAVPGRAQVLRQEPLVLLDGGHNEDGVRALAALLRESGISTWYGICGMTHQDASEAAARQLAPLMTTTFCVDGFAGNAMPAETLCAAFCTCGRGEVSALEEALPRACALAGANGGAVVIFGSLYLASWFLNREQEG